MRGVACRRRELDHCLSFRPQETQFLFIESRQLSRNPVVVLYLFDMASSCQLLQYTLPCRGSEDEVERRKWTRPTKDQHES